MSFRYKVALLLAVIIMASACAPAQQEGADGAAAAPQAVETVVFGDYNWPSAQVQNRIAQYIVEKGYGYPTDVVFGATLPLFQGLRRGDINVSMEIWLPNQIEAWSSNPKLVTRNSNTSSLTPAVRVTSSGS